MPADFYPFTRGKNQEKAIQAGTTNLTLGSGIVALVAVLAGSFTDFAEKVLGEPENVPNVVARKDLLVALIFGWAIVAAADLSVRAYGKGKTEKRQAAETIAKEQTKVALQHLVAAPAGLTVSVPEKAATNEPNWSVIAVRVDEDNANKLKFFVAKAGQKAEWLSEDKLTFQ